MKVFHFFHYLLISALLSSPNVTLSNTTIQSDVVKPSNTFYIDPQYSGPKNGTINQPYNSWKDITWKNGYSYLFKAGSTLEVSYPLRPGANNVTIGSYGNGNKPHIKSSVPNGQKVLDLARLANIVVKDLDVESTNNATTCISFMNSNNATVMNCSFHGAEWGMRNINSSGSYKITNCELYMTGDDGSYNQGVD
jgi:hypothetical protein